MGFLKNKLDWSVVVSAISQLTRTKCWILLCSLILAKDLDYTGEKNYILGPNFPKIGHFCSLFLSEVGLSSRTLNFWKFRLARPQNRSLLVNTAYVVCIFVNFTIPTKKIQFSLKTLRNLRLGFQGSSKCLGL